MIGFSTPSAGASYGNTVGVQLSGTGGTWVVDVPLTSFLQATPVPEPASALLFSAGGALLLLGMRRLRR